MRVIVFLLLLDFIELSGPRNGPYIVSVDGIHAAHPWGASLGGCISFICGPYPRGRRPFG